jgi:hypothetical protein
MSDSEFWKSAFLASLAGGRNLEQAEIQADRAIELWKKKTDWKAVEAAAPKAKPLDHVGVGEKPATPAPGALEAKRGPGRPKKVAAPDGTDSIDVEVSTGE